MLILTCRHAQLLSKRPILRTPSRKQQSAIVCTSLKVQKRVKIDVGASGLKSSRIGLGTLQWGDPGQGFGERYSQEDLQKIFNRAVEGGVNFFDTAEVYGYQGIKNGTSSEHILGSFVADLDTKALEDPLVIGTKFFTIPWTNFLVGGGFRLGKGSIMEALTGSLGKLAEVDLYQVHFPFPTFPQSILADALTEIMEKGLVKAVGVCNYNLQQMTELQSLLGKRGIPLASNQVKCSVLEQKAIREGLLGACKDSGTLLIAHSPLSQGLLTEKYVESGGGGQAEKLRPLLKLMQFIGALNGGKTVAQVALNYLTSQGIMPIPGAKTLAQVEDLVESLDWELNNNEVEVINERLGSL